MSSELRQVANSLVRTNTGSVGKARPLSERLWTAGTYAMMCLLGIFFLAPLVFMIVGSLKPNNLFLAQGSTWRAFFPPQATLENYREAFQRADFGRLFLNSAGITSATVLAGMLVNSMFGYALARFRFRGKGIILAVVIALIIVPLEAYAIPLLYMMAKLRMIDTYMVQVLPFVANPFFIYLFYTFFLTIPKALEEAARVDGAGPFTIFFKIVVPLARPAYATVAILSFLFSWGQLLWPVLVTRGPKVRPLPLGIAEFQSLPPINWGDIMAYATMMTIPVLIVFLVFQNAFVRGVSRSGIKS